MSQNNTLQDQGGFSDYLYSQISSSGTYHSKPYYDLRDLSGGGGFVFWNSGKTRWEHALTLGGSSLIAYLDGQKGPLPVSIAGQYEWIEIGKNNLFYITKSTDDECSSLICCEQTINGFVAHKFKILVQKVEGDARPDPAKWREIDYTDQLKPTMIDDFITPSGMTKNTFVVTKELYDNAKLYELDSYINIPQKNEQEILGFGDEYYFYGNVETDIESTIYEMRYNVILANNEFQNSSNPTWNKQKVKQPYITEIGLYNEEKDLLVINKFQSPQIRLPALQTYTIKIDF